MCLKEISSDARKDLVLERISWPQCETTRDGDGEESYYKTPWQNEGKVSAQAQQVQSYGGN